MISIRPLEDQAALSSLISQQHLQPFLQSWVWGEFQASLGRPIWRLGAYDGDQLVGAAVLIGHELLLGKTYLYCPRGPLAMNMETWQSLMAAIRKTGQEAGAMYVKVDPGVYDFAKNNALTAEAYAMGTTLQPHHTLLIDVAQDPEQLLGQMHSKTRYNIRLADKKGVTARWSTSDDDLQSFLRLMHITAERQGIRLHSDGYYQKLFAALVTAKMSELIIAEHDGVAVAAHMIIWHGATATYLHGGSDDKHKEVMAPYWLQWQTILEAHRRGMKDYDLWESHQKMRWNINGPASAASSAVYMDVKLRFLAR